MNPIFLALLIFTLLINACSDEFNMFEDEVDIVDDHENTIIVYANFSPSNELHFVRVNRGYSAENFYAGAGTIDSLQFAPDEVDVKVFRLRNDDTVASYECRDTILQKMEGNFFYAEEVIAFYFHEPDLLGIDTSGAIQYAVQVCVGEDTVTAQTNAIKDFDFFYPPDIPYILLEFEGEQFRVEINKALNSQIYKVSGIGRYKEITEINGDKDTVLRKFNFAIAKTLENRPATGGKKKFFPPCGIFYDALEQDVITNGDTVNTVKRMFDRVAFRAISGNSDLALIQSSSDVFTGFHDYLNELNNVENGLGFFSSYNQTTTRFYEISGPSRDSIVAFFGEKYKFTR